MCKCNSSSVNACSLFTWERLVHLWNEHSKYVLGHLYNEQQNWIKYQLINNDVVEFQFEVMEKQLESNLKSIQILKQEKKYSKTNKLATVTMSQQSINDDAFVVYLTICTTSSNNIFFSFILHFNICSFILWNNLKTWF